MKPRGIIHRLLVLFPVVITSCGSSEKGDTMRSITAKFEQLEVAWTEQCSAHSDSSDGNMPRQQPAFNELVGMGSNIAPLVVDRIRRNQLHSDLNPNSVEYHTEWLPWAWVLEEITNHRLEDDAGYRELVREHYRKTNSEGLSKIFDPDGVGYVEEIAVPHLLDWWEKTGKNQFNSSRKEKTNG